VGPGSGPSSGKVDLERFGAALTGILGPILCARDSEIRLTRRVAQSHLCSGRGTAGGFHASGVPGFFPTGRVKNSCL
jgi:hypothetical protein